MKLKKLEVNAFAGISPNSPVVIDFTQSKFVRMEGNEGRGKTSMINALLVATGQISKDKDFVNIDTGKIDINFDFVGKDGYTYNLRATKSSFILSYEGVAQSEPISKLKELLGVVGVSPMDIKYKPLKEIVKWLATYSNTNPEEFQKKLDKHKANIKAAQETRRDANKSVKGLNEYLNNEDLYRNWEDSEKKFKKAVDVKELSAKLDVAGKESDKVIRAEEKLKNYKEQRVTLVEEIESIKNELSKKEHELVLKDEVIQAGIEYVEFNKGKKKEYDVIKKQYDNAAAESIAYNKWHEIKKKKTELDEFETISQNADAKEKKILQDVKELQAEILPDIRGVELVTQDTHEDGISKKEGLYWNGKNFAQLSESETWDLVLMIWRKYKVKVVVVDNYSNLGSMASEILQKLSKDGAYILAAQMDRTKKELEIIYE